jgi:SHS2 domain-containing protein
MKRFRYVPHTADIAFVAYGKSIEEAMENAVLAMLNVMLDLKRISRSDAQTHSIRIREKANNLDSLVWYTLQHILSAVDEKKLNAYGFRVLGISTAAKKSSATLEGMLEVKASKKDFSLLEVKAVTPHDMHVEKKRGLWSIRVLLDV